MTDPTDPADPTGPGGHELGPTVEIAPVKANLIYGPAGLAVVGATLSVLGAMTGVVLLIVIGAVLLVAGGFALAVLARLPASMVADRDALRLPGLAKMPDTIIPWAELDRVWSSVGDRGTDLLLIRPKEPAVFLPENNPQVKAEAERQMERLGAPFVISLSAAKRSPEEVLSQLHSLAAGRATVG